MICYHENMQKLGFRSLLTIFLKNKITASILQVQRKYSRIANGFH